MKKTIFSLAAVTTIMAATTVTASAEELIVKKGDTLWGMAQENGVSVNHIKEQNNLNSNLIVPNQRLTIKGEHTHASKHSTSNQGTYTVQSGDTLWSIGQNQGASVNSLKAWNNLSSNLIYPGQQLAVQGSAVQQVENSNESHNETKAVADTSSSEQTNDVAKTMTMEATAYTANCVGCSGTTYTGIDLKANPDRKVIAVDPNVIPLGSEVYVEGYGKAVAGDIGGAIDGNRIDVFIPNRSDALDFGRRTVEVKVLN